MPLRDQNPGVTKYLAQTNFEDYQNVGHKHWGMIGTQIETKSAGKREIIHDPYRSRLEVKPMRDRRYYNPNDYIQISPAEIERQAKELLETMKKNSDFHEENLKANQWKETL